MFKVIKKEGSARRGEFVTVHGTVQTPAFMNVATCGAIKGAVSALDALPSAGPPGRTLASARCPGRYAPARGRSG